MTKIIVTGASGVVGSAVLDRLSRESDVFTVALTRQSCPKSNLSNLVWKQTDYSADNLIKLFDGAEALIHLAGVKGDKIELSDFDIDILMTENILKAAHQNDISRIIYSSSRLVYANPEKIPWDEDTVPEPVTAYAINKVRTEDLCHRYSAQYNMHIVIARVAQVISAKDTMRNMVNVFRDLASSGRPLSVIGKSISKRQYIYDKDLAEILWRLLRVDCSDYEIVNIGMLESYTNYEIAEAFNRAYKNKAPIQYDDSMPETITPSEMSVQKMLKLTDFTPMNMDHALADMAHNTY